MALKNVSLPRDRGDELRLAAYIARQAGNMMLRGFNSDMCFKLKQDNSRVTDTDIAINAFVIRTIRQRFPKHDIIGEEASDRTASPFAWVTDPIDGTLPFSLGVPTSCFSLALVEHGMPTVGVVHDPFKNHMFHARKGGGSFLNNNQLHVSNSRLEKGLVALSYFESATIDLMPLHQIFRRAGADTLGFGSIVYDSMLVAQGKYVGALSPTQHAHDVAASKLIVEEAGGRVTDLFGREQQYNGKICGCIVSNGAAHQQIVDSVAQLLRL